MISDNELLFNSLKLFYEDNYNLTKLLNYLKVDKISLRIIDWFVTNYSKKYDSMYTRYDRNGKQLNPFNVFHSYKSQLKSYSKKFFDPFCRRNRIKYKYNDTDILSTTIGQLNFFKWAINYGVIDYIKDNYKEIEDDMNESIRLIRKNTIKTNERKKRQELSLSASRGLNKHHEKIIIDFN
tara:strand:- start:257 stop:799 length:543 start_codon:yes stop_codon:yes gene_type:complete